MNILRSLESGPLILLKQRNLQLGLPSFRDKQHAQTHRLPHVTNPSSTAEHSKHSIHSIPSPRVQTRFFELSPSFWNNEGRSLNLRRIPGKFAIYRTWCCIWQTHFFPMQIKVRVLPWFHINGNIPWKSGTSTTILQMLGFLLDDDINPYGIKNMVVHWLLTTNLQTPRLYHPVSQVAKCLPTHQNEPRRRHLISDAQRTTGRAPAAVKTCMWQRLVVFVL